MKTTMKTQLPSRRVLVSLLLVSFFVIPITSVSCKGKSRYVGWLVADEIKRSREAKEREELQELQVKWRRKHHTLLESPSRAQMEYDDAMDKISENIRRGGTNK
ncbi:MAG: hypothetical protein WCO57_16610 [Verrucomicrobiota bacterium]